MMTSLQQTIGSIASSLTNTVNTALGSNTPPAMTNSDLKKLEETERERRLEHVSQTRIDKQNAANVSNLVRAQSFPVFKGNVSKGYKRVTTRFEEDERRRRLTNKSESALRRNNAHQTARMIQKLGWPLYKGSHDGPEYIMMDSTKLLEEEEREWRTNDSYWTTTAKHNAATVANIVRWNSFQKNPKAGYRRHISFLEEKERRDRLSPNTKKQEMDNAYRVAGIIKQMGPPFYVQTPSANRDLSSLHKLEEQERERRIHAPAEQQLARELAGIVGDHLKKDNDPEEQERGRRMKDLPSQKLAQQNAKHVSLMVRESSANKLGAATPMWFSISRNSMRALEEIERTRRVRDVDGQTKAKQHAKQVSDIVLHKWSQPSKPSLNTIEEEERQSRVLDRPQQQLAMKNARKVSGLIAKHNLTSKSSRSFALALEEGERSRRLQDRDQENLARDNAKRVSSLVSSLNVAPGRHVSSTRDAPLSPAKMSSIPPTDALPTFHAPLSAAPITVNMPTSSPLVSAPIVEAPQHVEPYAKEVPASPLTTLPLDSQRSESPLIAAAPVTRSVAPVSAPLVSAAPIVSAKPITSAAPLTYAAPLTSAAPIISAAPITSTAPLTSAPRSVPLTSAAPITSVPLTSAAPITSAPRSVPLTYAAPLTSAAPIFTSAVPITSAAPISRSTLSSSQGSPTIQPIVLPSTTNPVPVTPLANTTTLIRQTSFNTPTVPVDSIAIAHPALGERQRKKLLKQAERHNRRSDKDVRKAEQSMLKAEKFHQRGRDDKALKLEHKAEHLMKAAENERRWANGLQGEIAPNAPAPASM